MKLKDIAKLCKARGIITLTPVGGTQWIGDLGAACRAAQALGYKRIVTYTRQSENGASLRASNWTCDGQAGGTHWTGQRYEQTELVLDEMKVRWRKEL